MLISSHHRLAVSHRFSRIDFSHCVVFSFWEPTQGFHCILWLSAKIYIAIVDKCNIFRKRNMNIL